MVFINIDEIPLPTETESRTIDGRYEVELDAATNTILSDLKKENSKVNEKILLLPADADALKIFAFYEPKMTEKGFSNDANVPLQGKNYQLKIWRNDGWLGGQAIAVAVIDAGTDADGKAIKFLAIFQAEK
ncbi:MAG: hypothetical protein ACR2F2_04980 [Pyrinomonadaceae bacterium]